MYDESRVCHKFSPLPALDVAESGESDVIRNGDDGFAFFHFGSDIIGFSFGDACSTHKGGIGHDLADVLGEGKVLRAGYLNGDRHSGVLK